MAKKNNTAEKTVLDAEKITSALKEGTEKQLRALMNEAISNLIKEDEDEPELEDEHVPAEDDSYEVEDVDAEGAPAEDETPEAEDADAEGEDAAPADEPAEDGDADDEWSDLEQYKVGDNDYDFTGVDGETALKVFNKLGDDDEIFVTKNEDGDYEFKDDKTGAEYVIELDPEGDADADAEGDADVDLGDEGDDEGFDLDIDFGDEGSEPEDGGDELSLELGNDEPEDGEQEFEIDLGDDDEENHDELNEDLGYTDSYQKDVFAKKPNMSEPAKGMNDWDEGAPKGAEKPWAGKGDMKPFGKKAEEVNEEVNECGVVPSEDTANLEEDGSGLNTKHSTKKTQNRLNKDAKNQRHVSQNGEYTPLKIDEAKVRKIVEAAKAIQAENKQYKDQIEKIKKSLFEAAVLNVNLGKVVSLLVNETTTRAEKKSILERFNNVKTIKEGTALYESIKKELNGETKKAAIMERQISMAPSLNETTIYQDNPALDMMRRMDNLENYYK